MSAPENTPAVKAIETRYRGYRFRSRLEARWAVFFDALEIRWLYEPEGFELSDGTRYLPDFHLPDFGGGTWVEVKREDADWGKAKRFAVDSGNSVWLAHGDPGANMYDVVTGTGMAGNRPDAYGHGGEMEVLRECVPLGSEAQGENRMYSWMASEAADEGGLEGWLTENAPHVLSALLAARAARWEFGESPDKPNARLRAAEREGWVRHFQRKRPDLPAEVWNIVLDLASGDEA